MTTSSVKETFSRTDIRLKSGTTCGLNTTNLKTQLWMEINLTLENHERIIMHIVKKNLFVFPDMSETNEPRQ